MESNSTPLDLVRTEINHGGALESDGWLGRSARYGLAPEVGDVLQWGIKSASYDPEWVYRIVNDMVPGMVDCEGRTIARDGAEVVAYHIEQARRYLDIAHLSDWNQSEALVAGSYEVIGAEREVIESEIEHFITKKGEPFIRYGGHTRCAADIDSKVVNTFKCPGCMVPVTHIRLRELA